MEALFIVYLKEYNFFFTKEAIQPALDKDSVFSPISTTALIAVLFVCLF